MTLVSATFRVNLMIVEYPWDASSDSFAFQAELRTRLGASIKHTAVLLFPTESGGTYSAETLTRTTLLLPDYDLNGHLLRPIYRSSDFTRFWDNVIPGGTALNFSITSIPEFKFTGINHRKNYLIAYDPAELNFWNAQTPSYVKTINGGSWVGYNSYEFSMFDSTRVSDYTAQWFHDNLGSMYPSVDITVIKGLSKMEIANLGFTAGGGPVTNLFTDLADVNIPVSQPNQSIHYNAITAKYEQTPEVKIIEATRTFIVDTTGAVTLLSNGDASLASSAGEFTGSGLSVQIDATAGNVGIDATGRVVVGGDTGAVVGSANGSVELQCAVAGTEYCKINTSLESASTYATKISGFDDAIPNTKYVADAISNLAENIYNTDGTLTGARTITQATNALTFNDGEFNVYANTANVSLNTTDGVISVNAAGTGNASLTANSGNASITTFGTAEISGNTAVNIISGTGYITLDVDATHSVNINSTGGGSPATYAALVAGIPAAVPNVAYVTTAITAIPAPPLTGLSDVNIPLPVVKRTGIILSLIHI